MRRLPPVRKPDPLAADDMYQRVSHGTESTAKIARELLSPELQRAACKTLLFAQRSYW